jgi:uncharacterized FlaG/YvyC family protein
MNAHIQGLGHTPVSVGQIHNQHLGKSPTQATSQTTQSDGATYKTLQQAVAKTNGELQRAGTKVELNYDTKSNRVWIKVVDNNGKVLMEMPPKGIQEAIDALNSHHLYIDLKA